MATIRKNRNRSLAHLSLSTNAVGLYQGTAVMVAFMGPWGLDSVYHVYQYDRLTGNLENNS